MNANKNNKKSLEEIHNILLCSAANLKRQNSHQNLYPQAKFHNGNTENKLFKITSKQTRSTQLRDVTKSNSAIPNSSVTGRHVEFRSCDRVRDETLTRF